MSPVARLTSVDALDQFAAAMDRFGEEAAVALADLQIDMNRAAEWIRHDRRDFWGTEVRRGWERMAEARINLERAMMFKGADNEPSCYDERKAMERAKRRLQTAEEKVEAVRHWNQVLDREFIEFKGVLNQLIDWLQIEFPQSLAALRRMRQAVDQYLAVRSTADVPTPTELSSAVPPAAGVAQAAAGSDAATAAAAEEAAQAAEDEVNRADESPLTPDPAAGTTPVAKGEGSDASGKESQP